VSSQDYQEFVKENYVLKFAKTFKIDFKSKFLVELWTREFAKFPKQALDDGWDTFMSTVTPNYLPKLDVAKEIFRIETNRINEKKKMETIVDLDGTYPKTDSAKFSEVTQLANDLLAGRIKKADYYLECSEMYGRFGDELSRIHFKELEEKARAGEAVVDNPEEEDFPF
jgi:hypothetical protein